MVMWTFIPTLPFSFGHFISEIKLNINHFSPLTLWFCKNTRTFSNVVVRAQGDENNEFSERLGRKHKNSNNQVIPAVKRVKAKKRHFTEETCKEINYFGENGLRKVYPYNYTFTTFCKERWIGQTVVEVFSKEYRIYLTEEYKRCINTGAITVNDNKIDISYKLQKNDLLTNTVHRHEAPVADLPIKVLHEFHDLVVVDKPSSIPVHPCGRYNHNTVTGILAKEFNLKNLKTIHRLDSLTSGLLLFGKDEKKSRQVQKELSSRLVNKEYVCRVMGEFPTATVNCEEPIEVASHKIGVRRVGLNGKHCKTKFERISYNGKTSVVLCKPLTGRTHQIRVHLQFLGYPIVNDPIYNHSAFGLERGKGGIINKTNEELARELIDHNTAESYIGVDSVNTSIPSFSKSRSHLLPFDPTKLAIDSNCPDCKLRFRDPNPEDLVMYLHAWRYQGCDWKFESELPKWVNDN